MLTSMYYYQHYKPYMIKSAATAGNKLAKQVPLKERIATENPAAPNEVALNKALNKDVVNYAKGIYRNTTDLRYTSKKLASDIRNYDKYKNFEEFDKDAFEKNFDEDLVEFSDSYNRSSKFLKSQPHSPFLGQVAENLENIVSDSEKILSVMGVTKNDEGELKVDGNANTFWNGKNTAKKTEAAEKMFASMHEETADILNNPMSKHMDFKSLNYYYNYKVDKVQVDSFQIIKTGLLVNLAL